MNPAVQAAAVVSDLDSLEQLRHSRPKGMVSLGRFARRFGYLTEQVEVLAGMSPGTARQNPFALRLQRFMARSLDVVARRMAQSGDLDEAIAWFRGEPLAQFGDRTPEQVVASEGAGALLHALH